MLKILHREGRAAPVFVCDICGDMICDATEGLAVFSCTAKDNEKTEVIHAHKGRCHDEAEKRFENDGWAELGRHLYMLTVNTGPQDGVARGASHPVVGNAHAEAGRLAAPVDREPGLVRLGVPVSNNRRLKLAALAVSVSFSLSFGMPLSPAPCRRACRQGA